MACCKDNVYLEVLPKIVSESVKDLLALGAPEVGYKPDPMMSRFIPMIS